jgi:hypothetical protein
MSTTNTPLLPKSPASAPNYGGSSTSSHSLLNAADNTPAVPGKREVHKNQLGIFNGVFIPCCLNIMGVILFLKLGWGVGMTGTAGMLLIFVVGDALCVLTVLSLSAIITNGDMSGGGSYYMISRSLGPEFGGAIGLLFYLAYALGASFYFIGFAEGVALASFIQPILCPSDEVQGVGCVTPTNFNRIVGLFSLAVSFGIAWGGAEVGRGGAMEEEEEVEEEEEEEEEEDGAPVCACLCPSA